MKLQVKNPDIVKKLVLAKLSTGLQPALEKAKEQVEKKFDQNPAGWVPLKAATIAQRQRLHFGAGPILYRTGHLQGVAVQEIAVDSPTEGHISTQDPLAVLQNNGGGNGIPTRPFYDITGEDKAAIFEAFLKGISW